MNVEKNEKDKDDCKNNEQYKKMNVPLLIFDILLIPISLIRIVLIYFWGSKYNLTGCQFLDVIMHADKPFFNRDNSRVNTIGTDYRIVIRDDSRIFPMDIKSFLNVNKFIPNNSYVTTIPESTSVNHSRSITGNHSGSITGNPSRSITGNPFGSNTNANDVKKNVLKVEIGSTDNNSGPIKKIEAKLINIDQAQSQNSQIFQPFKRNIKQTLHKTQDWNIKSDEFEELKHSTGVEYDDNVSVNSTNSNETDNDENSETVEDTESIEGNEDTEDNAENGENEDNNKKKEKNRHTISLGRQQIVNSVSSTENVTNNSNKKEGPGGAGGAVLDSIRAELDSVFDDKILD